MKRLNRFFRCGQTVGLLMVSFLAFSYAGHAQQRVYTVSNAHSHNDYEQRIPYWMAYDAGFGSIEADIFLVDTILYVAHDREELKRKMRLDSAYLIPIQLCLQENNHHAYANNKKKLQLLIDIKTDSINTLNALIFLLKRYPSLTQSHSVTWVITGNRPDESLFTDYPDFIRFDGELHKNYSKKALTKISLMSDDFKFYSLWNGVHDVSGKDDSLLSNAVKKSHGLNKPVRFWDAPDTANAWRKLMILDVDYINTDHIRALADFLHN